MNLYGIWYRPTARRIAHDQNYKRKLLQIRNFSAAYFRGLKLEPSQGSSVFCQ